MEQRREVKKPNQNGLREYFHPFCENPCGPWNEISADETIQGIKALAKDLETSVVVIISKPPSLKVVDSLIEKVQAMSKPAVLCLFDSNIEDPKVKNIYITETLEDASRTALSLSNNEQSIARMDETRISEL